MTCFICAGNTCLGECELKIKAKNVSDLQQLLALKDLEIMRLREALEEIKLADDSAYYVCEKIAEQTLSTPATYDDLMAWHNEQLGEPMGWFNEDYPAERYGDLEEFAYDYGSTDKARPLYAKKGE
jgi:hypothetical protein